MTDSMHSDHGDFVRRGEFEAVKELSHERHNTVLLRLEQLSGQMDSLARSIDAHAESDRSLSGRLLWQGIILLLLTAVNLPGLWHFVKDIKP